MSSGHLIRSGAIQALVVSIAVTDSVQPGSPSWPINGDRTCPHSVLIVFSKVRVYCLPSNTSP